MLFGRWCVCPTNTHKFHFSHNQRCRAVSGNVTAPNVFSLVNEGDYTLCTENFFIQTIPPPSPNHSFFIFGEVNTVIDFTFDLQRFDDDPVTISNLSSLGKYAKDGDYYELTSGTYNITGSVALDKPIVIPAGATVVMDFAASKKFSAADGFNGGDIKKMFSQAFK